MPGKRRSASNDNVINKAVLSAMRKAKDGYYPAYKELGNIYQHAIGVEKDIQKAIKLYEDFYKIHRAKRYIINEIEFLINLGNLYFELGNKIKAAETYFHAGMEIQYPGRYKDSHKLLKKYNIKQLIEKTGCESFF